MIKKLLVIFVVGLFFAGLSRVSLAMMCADKGTSGEEHSSRQQLAQAETAKPDAATPVKKAEDAGNKICPVSGEKIGEKMKATYAYEGKTYNFCCAMCIDNFKKDPQKYIKKVEEEKQIQEVNKKDK